MATAPFDPEAPIESSPYDNYDAPNASDSLGVFAPGKLKAVIVGTPDVAHDVALLS